MDMREVRMRFPQYDDMGDVELATALHRKFYSDMPVADFYKKVGLTESPVNAAEDMSGIDQARAGLGKVFVDLGRGIAQMHARLCRAGGLLHDKPLASEILGQGFAQGSFVIDEEQAGCLTLIHG